MPKDANGVELEVGDRVMDELFGTGTIVGMVPLIKGTGLNVLVQWDSGREPGRGGRSSEHMRRVATVPTVASTPHKRLRRASIEASPSSPSQCRHSPRLQELRDLPGAGGTTGKVAAVVIDRVRHQEASFMVNFFGRVPNKTAVMREPIKGLNSCAGPSAASSSTTKAAEPELAAHEKVRAKKRKTTYKRKRDEEEKVASTNISDEEAETSPVMANVAVRERGPNKAGRITKQSHVSLAKRLKDFPDQALKISAGDLSLVRSRRVHMCWYFCSLCFYSQVNFFVLAARKRFQI